MATLPAEQVTQRNKTADVSIVYDNRDGSPGEKLWLSTTTLPYQVVMTKVVAANQKDRQVLEDRIDAAGEAKYGDFDLYTEEGIGTDSLPQPLVVLGDGTEDFGVTNGTTDGFEVNLFVRGGYTPLSYEIEEGTTIDNGTAQMVGSVLEYTATSAGSDVIPVIVTDRDGNTVTVTVTVTVT